MDIVYKDTEAYVDDVYTCDDDLLKKSRIEGRFPMNDYEILIHNNPQLYLTYNNGYHEILDIQLSIGDSFQLNGQDVTVVGIVQPAEILKYNDPVDGLFNFERYYLSTYTGIYVTPSLYQTINGVYEQDYIDIYYQTEKEKNIMISQILNQYPELLNNIEDKNSIEIYSGSNARSFAESSIHSYVLYASMSICIFLCYFINKNEMFNRRNDYALCQLIGMTKRDLLNKQIAKGIIIFVLVISIQTFFVIMECTYLENWTIPYMEFIILSLFVFVICLLIYVTPLYFVLKHKPLDNLRKID
ncbi:MAG: FtsX-like permease family protein [Coprobacillus cateniformis]